MMRQLQGGAMPRHCRVGPLTPPFTDALGFVCSEESLPPNQAASLIGQPAASHEGKTRAFPLGREPDRGASVMR